MEELLKRWAKVEPDRCRLDEKTGDLAVMLRGNWKKALTFMREADPERIEGAVREAIEARGLRWHLESVITKNGLTCYLAYIIGTFKQEEFVCDTPAEALISAHIAALEAQIK